MLKNKQPNGEVEVGSGKINDIVELLDESVHEIVFHGRYRNLEELPGIVDNLSALLKHHSYVVRADAYEFIAAYQLKQFAEQIREGCSDRNQIARTYAMGAYYDLLGTEAIPLLKRFLSARETRVCLEALCLLYVESREDEYLNRIAKIVTRKNCNVCNQSVVVSNFESLLQLQEYPEILLLFDKMLSMINKKYGLAKDLRKLLKDVRRESQGG